MLECVCREVREDGIFCTREGVHLRLKDIRSRVTEEKAEGRGMKNKCDSFKKKKPTYDLCSVIPANLAPAGLLDRE